jgi:L-rhamnose 1-dehydrogenase
VLLKDKVVIVTGGSRGIGRAIAVACATEGADVAINYWGDNDASYGRRSAVAEVVGEIEALGRRVIAIEGNVAARETGHELVRHTVEAFGKVDVLASNAGICPFHAFLDMPPEMLEATVAVNLNGAFYVTQAAAQQMKKQGTGGAIVATSSISALVGGGMQTHYTPTKAGVHSLMQSCAVALGPYGIRCNSVMPGTIATHSAGPPGPPGRRRRLRSVSGLRSRALCDRRGAAGRRRPLRQPAVKRNANFNAPAPARSAGPNRPRRNRHVRACERSRATGR